MELDIKTVVVIGMITSGMIAIVLASSGPSGGARGFREATLGAVAGCLSFLALLGRGTWPDVISVALSNSLVMLCPAFYLRAHELFCSSQPRKNWALPAAGAMSVLFVSAWFFGADYEVRSLIVSSGIMLFTAGSALELARGGGLWREHARRIGIFICVLTVLSQAGRIVLLLIVGPDPEGNIFAASLERSFAFFPAVIYAVGIGFGFVMMHNERNYARSVALALSDPLTGCANRRALDAAVEREAMGRPLALIVLDIDGFKQINDRHGHDVGDMVIVDMAALLKHEVGAAGTVARYGGEEFCVLLPGADNDNAATLAERLRLAIRWHRFPQGIFVTASFGVAAATGRTFNWRDCFRRADAALYRAKREGRNRVFVAAPEGDALEPSMAATLATGTAGL